MNRILRLTVKVLVSTRKGEELFVAQTSRRFPDGDPLAFIVEVWSLTRVGEADFPLWRTTGSGETAAYQGFARTTGRTPDDDMAALN